MEILSISGSPRNDGNTSKILEIVSSRLSDIANVEICRLTDHKINGCLGCSCCQEVHDRPGCVQQDDAQMLLSKIIDADIVLYGTPLYGHSYSGQLKLFMDRHVALFKFVDGSDKAVGDMEIHSFIDQKPVGLIVSCQGPEEDNTELIKMQFDRFCQSSLAGCLGKYVFPWCGPAADQSEYAEETIHKIISDIKNCL